MITINLTHDEHQYLLILLGRGTASLIRPGESLSGEQAIALADRVVRAGERTDD